MTADPAREPSPRGRLREWLGAHRRQIGFALLLIVVALVFCVIGATAPKFIMPNACKVYG